jgi:hypothetical protein
MSLAFALMAAINGSTGSRATLSFGLCRPKPRRRRPGGGKDSRASEVAAQAATDTILIIPFAQPPADERPDCRDQKSDESRAPCWGQIARLATSVAPAGGSSPAQHEHPSYRRNGGH